MNVLSSWDLYKGKKGEWDKTGILTQPQQMLTRDEKSDAWRKQNLDWWEHIGVMQLRSKYKKAYKNYNLASGIIDKTDYIPDPNQNDYGELINILTKENESPYEIRFYPIIPTVINVLTGEFSKRNTRVNIKAVDEYAINEMLDQKKEMITQYVVQKAQQGLLAKLAQQGIDPESEEAANALKEVPNLPQIQEFFKKSYRSIAEQWAVHELNEAEERFNIGELEVQGFKDKLAINEEFWHIRLLEDDYQVELWSPLNSFYHKSPEVAYISEGNYVGRIHLLTIADVIDRWGYKMTEDEIKRLQAVASKWLTNGKMMPPDATTTDYWNPTKPKSEQIQSIHWHDAVTSKTWLDNGFNGVPGQPLMDFLKEDEHTFVRDFLIVTEVYWKSQRRIGHLKQVDEKGKIFEDIVSEDYKVTVKPIYDITIDGKKNKDNLIFGQHVDWIWINEVWQGTKIGLSFLNSWAAMSDGFDPIYLDVRPLPFQFRADGSLYSAKLPVEGFLGYNRNVRKNSLVDQMKPFQIGYNMVNNQISDLLVDEVGNVILLDQNMIPKNSMDGSWGKYNFTKAYQVMKNFGILPVDSSITNTDVPTNFNQTSVVNLEKTNQIASRIQLSDYFKNECYSTVGITRQRLGDVTSSESATGVEYSVNNSYAQTEMYFVEHSNYLMPRVKQMILNAAQYINANKPTIRKTYINREEENVFFEVEGTKILLADLRIYCTSKPDQKAVLDELKKLALNNNTSGATIFDLAKIVQSNSVVDIIETLKSSVDKIQQQQEQQVQAQKENTDATLKAQAESEEAQRQYEAEQKELDRQNERYIAEVKALGFNNENDLNQNAVPDALEVAKFNAEQGKYQADLGLKSADTANKQIKDIKDRELKAKDLDLKRQKLAEDIRLKEEDLKIQRENMKNDLAIARQNAKGRGKTKK